MLSTTSKFLLCLALSSVLMCILHFCNKVFFSSKSVLPWASCNLFLISETILSFSSISFLSLNNSPFTSDFCPFLVSVFEFVSQWFIVSSNFVWNTFVWNVHFSCLLLHECLLEIFLSWNVGNFTSWHSAVALYGLNFPLVHRYGILCFSFFLLALKFSFFLFPLNNFERGLLPFAFFFFYSSRNYAFWWLPP